MEPGLDLSDELLAVAGAGILGLATVDADRIVSHRVGQIVDWLPAEGTDCCQCLLLAGMEPELARLAQGAREPIVLPGVRGVLSGQDQPLAAVVLWSRTHYTVIAMPDFTARQVESLIGSERRARRLIEQQLEAAHSEVQFASLARTRLRLARDLHDTLVHSIMALLTQIRLVQHFEKSDPARVAASLAVAEDTAISGLARARDAIARLRLPDGLDTMPDIEAMLDELGGRTGMEVSVELDDGAREALQGHATTIKRILAEALRNIEAHAGAHRVSVRAAQEIADGRRNLVLEIRDDGRGFDVAERKPGHFGLVGMAEFAEMAGGACAVVSAPDRGTVVRVSLPIATPPVAPMGAERPS